MESDLAKMLMNELGGGETGQKEGTDLSSLPFCSSRLCNSSLSSLPTIAADIGGLGTPGLDSNHRYPGAPVCSSLAWLKLAPLGL